MKYSRPLESFFLFLLIITLSIAVQQANAECQNINNESIQRIIDEQRIHHNIPGLSLTINCPSESDLREFVSGTTMASSSTLINSNHLFQVGSLTKSFVAVIILQLEAEGRLSLNDPLTKWIDNINDAWKTITIRELLNHTSGIYNYTDALHDKENGNYADPYKQWSSEELVHLASLHPLYFDPGTNWHYSNTNYVLAGMIIETATSHTIQEEMNARIFTPLSLQNTAYLPTIADSNTLSRMAHGYSKWGIFPDEPTDITDTNLSWANAAGSLISTSHDMAIWFRQLMNGSLLPKQQMDELMNTVSTHDALPNASKDNSYGLGVMYDPNLFGEKIWWHSGGTLGYSSFMVWLKDYNIIIAMTLNHAGTIPDVYELTQEIVKNITQSNLSTNKILGIKNRHTIPITRIKNPLS